MELDEALVSANNIVLNREKTVFLSPLSRIWGPSKSLEGLSFCKVVALTWPGASLHTKGHMNLICVTTNWSDICLILTLGNLGCFEKSLTRSKTWKRCLCFVRAELSVSTCVICRGRLDVVIVCKLVGVSVLSRKLSRRSRWFSRSGSWKVRDWLPLCSLSGQETRLRVGGFDWKSLL